ncbi:hypothetical protein DH2020_020925 [Rehmannia glutinosa]|uniref:Leucine-rich repeat-containing N-terminal plant-type domain-containing protein n=1 Tax=Rehmannia glutinosa TaxID=99300 RepID=A0ABR0WDA4_REHGL
MMSGSNPTNAALFFFLIFFMASLKLTFCIGNSSSNTIIACPEIEKQALVSFKQSLKDPSNLLSSWNNNGEVNCCKWKGVFCNNLTGHVIELHLQTLSGIINPSLLNIKYLKYLDLSQNQFDETMIPSFIGSLTSLEYLNLSNAGFYGKIPHNIGNLSNLHTLVLEDNSESLEVDSLEWLTGLSKLEHLNMNYVNLSKAAYWAQVINNLPSLIELHLSSCNLNDNNDDIANNITNSLAILDLSGNNFQSFDTPRSIFQLSNLIFLNLRFNSFQGPIPSITNTTCKLQYIDLIGNFFSSTIPEWLYTCKSLEYVSLGLNHLQGKISNAIANLTSLRSLDLSTNELSGKIPTEIANLCQMQRLDLGWNKLSGEISDSFGNMSDCFLGALEYLDLSDNQLSGHLTHQFGEFENLKAIDLSSNSLSGVIPNNIGNLSSLEALYLDSNKLTGNLPESMGQLSNLKRFFISDNTLEGVVTETHFARLSNLTTLSASRNNLTLKLINPNWIPSFKLTSLQLRSWNLGSGSQILSWIETQKNNMNDLDLSNTGISGNVPSWFWNILVLNISHNQFHGKIPSINGPEDQHVYLSSNKFSGPLPRVGNNVTELDLSNNSFSGDMSHFLCDTTYETYQLEILHLGGNHLTGELSDCWMKWPSLEVLNVGNNNFSGTIPKYSIGFLTNLRSFNLSGNHLTGLIPDSIGNMKQLESLDFSLNSLSGEIPSSFTSMSSLNYLNLSYNDLTGRIPESTQLLGFNESSFIGNKLCGRPLTINCKNDGKSSGPTHKLEDQDQEDEKPEIEWFYVFLSLGYAAGLSAFLTTWILKKSWREAYYKLLDNMWNKIYVYFYIRWTRLTRALGRN